jgi:AraC-like DNA-binding protein
MFRKQFKTSIRAKQTELRLEKARQLLADTDDRILNIAHESGYRHMGFFNAAFKRKFGITPSDWRRQNNAATGSNRRADKRTTAARCLPDRNQSDIKPARARAKMCP